MFQCSFEMKKDEILSSLNNLSFWKQSNKKKEVAFQKPRSFFRLLSELTSFLSDLNLNTRARSRAKSGEEEI